MKITTQSQPQYNSKNRQTAFFGRLRGGLTSKQLSEQHSLLPGLCYLVSTGSHRTELLPGLLRTNQNRDLRLSRTSLLVGKRAGMQLGVRTPYGTDVRGSCIIIEPVPENSRYRAVPEENTARNENSTLDRAPNGAKSS